MTRDQFAFEDILEEAEQLGPLSMAVTHPPAGLWSDLRCRCAESPIDPSDAWERRGQMRFTSSSRAMSDGASRHPRPECTVILRRPGGG